MVYSSLRYHKPNSQPWPSIVAPMLDSDYFPRTPQVTLSGLARRTRRWSDEISARNETESQLLERIVRKQRPTTKIQSKSTPPKESSQPRPHSLTYSPTH